ncbi:MAG: diphosphokinase / guanosine-3,5-bis(diphosphate) 3-diphosphatase [Alphaproteobacteria bacterium]|jgi:(p)ppGpp synthase/HD superfamily hydrolase|nr:diphosphokinase / guanosine-3,5-bis(diphosphate) 3-diphosphatase [Alphaproteobacteria bacterium]
MEQLITVLIAADTAARWHATQKRKGAAAEPYINHLLEVASMAATASEGNDSNLVIAALLHDSVEDQKIPREVIAESFGEDVASLVLEVSDDKDLPKPARKRLQIETAPDKTPRAKLLKIADKISNMNSVAVSPPADWPVERRLEYITWSKTVVAALGPDVDAALRAEFTLAAGRAELAARSQNGTKQLSAPSRPTLAIAATDQENS